jgi:uncharacterized membrane protein (UPF0127 family)/Flp pilus assembly protein protease CpaA
MMGPALLLADGRVVCPELAVADTAPRRMKGLLGRKSLDKDEGLLLRPAGSVHTAFMRFPIDVVFTDAELEVLDVRAAVQPWRAVGKRGAKAVLELPAGEAARRGIRPGMKLEVDRPASPAEGEAAWAIDAAALAAGGLGALAGLVRFGFGSTGVVIACFLAALWTLAVIDFKTHLIPNRIVLPAAALVLVLRLALFPDQALEWTAAALGCAGVLLVLALAKPGGLGMGDVKLGLLLGAGLGLQAVLAILIGCVALWPVAIWLLLRDGLDARTRALPLGPALALGATIVALAG